MFKRWKERIIWRTLVLCFVPLATISSQEEPKTAKKPQAIEVQIEVTDLHDGKAINNVDVLVRWGESKSDCAPGTTDSRGIAKMQHVPRGMVTIRLMAKAYKPFAQQFDLKTKEQPIKIELEKEIPPPAD
jgi:hypothetical protein